MSLQTISSILPIVYKTDCGSAFYGDSLDFLSELPDNSVNLFITSPPFALQRQKEYGNKAQADYIDWLKQFALIVFKKLKDDGSFVLDLGGAYQKGLPVRSLYNFKIPIVFCEIIGFFLAEEFFWHNPSKLPSPIEWVNKRKIRVKDSVNTIWWFSKTEYPKADIRNVLVPYSDRMKKLISNPDAFYKPKDRPSGHSISTSFGKDNGGAIPSNLLQISNADSNSQYFRYNKKINIKGHPARFPEKIPEFFINMLTDPGDLVIDIFAGSNTTGYVAESLNRTWISIDSDRQYIASGMLRFLTHNLHAEKIKNYYDSALTSELDLTSISGYQHRLAK
jgi:site-specific DNA-methyltransferase (cytosine-N4-specific)